MSTTDSAARARGEAIRAELLELLNSEPRTAAQLLPAVRQVGDVSLSEVEFQLGRLQDAGQVIGDGAGVHRLL